MSLPNKPIWNSWAGVVEGGTTNQWDYTQSEKRSRYAFGQLDGRRNIFAVKLAAINMQ